ncbi:MAG: integrase arm-type DNA-binding domain-containing protein [Herbaspirillum sp.]
MPKLAKPLTELQISKAKAKSVPYVLADGNGLSMTVSTAGSKAWVVRYRLQDGTRPAPATIGHYPTMTLLQARMRATEVQRDAKAGKTTDGIRKARQTALSAAVATLQDEQQTNLEREHATFRAVSSRWLADRRADWATETYRKAALVVESHLNPIIGDNDIRTMATKDVKPVLMKMHRSTPALAKKARQYLSSIIGHAIDDGLRGDDQVLRLTRILPAARSGHMPAITDDEEMLGDVIRAVQRYPNQVVRGALLLTAYTAMRAGATVCAHWSEFNLEKAVWKVPGKNPDGSNRMKTGQDFATSLPHQAIEFLKEMKERAGGDEYVFPPQARQNSPHLSRDALSKALREMGFQGKQTTHGFRATLRTLGRERLDIPVDVLEAQLAHAPKDEIQAAYARVKFTDQRRVALQDWADYLEKLSDKKSVIPMKRHTA